MILIKRRLQRYRCESGGSLETTSTFSSQCISIIINFKKKENINYVFSRSRITAYGVILAAFNPGKRNIVKCKLYTFSSLQYFYVIQYLYRLQGGPTNISLIQGGPTNIILIQGESTNIILIQGGPTNIILIQSGSINIILIKGVQTNTIVLLRTVH